MATVRETLIIFVCDMEALQKDDQTASSAIVYFHPTWVSDEQKSALCGQLAGTIHCVTALLRPPEIISLENGKFFVKQCHNYIMAIGTDRNIEDWLLRYRATLITDLMQMFHQNVCALKTTCDNNAKLCEKLYRFFETYLANFIHEANIFSHMPLLKFPKSSSDIYVEAMRLLEACQTTADVLGGAILYHNKIIASQLHSQLNKCLIMSDPYRVHCTADEPLLDPDLLHGQRIFYVYLEPAKFDKLKYISSIVKNLVYEPAQSSNNDVDKGTKTVGAGVARIPHDQAIMFSAVAEEDNSMQSTSSSVPESPPPFATVEPRHPESSDNQVLQDKIRKTILPNYMFNQVSVCSTPLDEIPRPVFSHMTPLYDAITQHSAKATSSQSKKHETDNASLQISVDEVSSKIKRFLSLPNIYDKDVAYKHATTRPKRPRKLIRWNSIADPTNHHKKSDKPTGNFIPLFVGKSSSKSSASTHTAKTETPTVPPLQFDEHGSICVNRVDSDSSLKSSKVKDRKLELSLPLSSVTTTSSTGSAGFGAVAGTRRPSHILFTPSRTQLTPLMSKLSQFSNQEYWQNAFDRGVTTPIFTPTHSMLPKIFPRSSSSKKTDKEKESSHNPVLRKCCLLVIGTNDIVIYLLATEEILNNISDIQKLIKLSIQHITHLEKDIQVALDFCPMVLHQNEPYSFVMLRDNWETVDRSGPWNASDDGLLATIHRNFMDTTQQTRQLIVRGTDGVIFASKMHTQEVFYCDSSIHCNTGLPTPADPISTVHSRAKKHLKVDHSIFIM